MSRLDFVCYRQLIAKCTRINVCSRCNVFPASSLICSWSHASILAEDLEDLPQPERSC